jgi:3-oxoacyl-[acyl-carrier-protein] synthase II
LLGNVPAFQDGFAHATINLDDPDPACDCGAPQIVANRPRNLGQVNYILNNSFGMLGINSVLIVKRFTE